MEKVYVTNTGKTVEVDVENIKEGFQGDRSVVDCPECDHTHLSSFVEGDYVECESCEEIFKVK